MANGANDIIAQMISTMGDPASSNTNTQPVSSSPNNTSTNKASTAQKYFNSAQSNGRNSYARTAFVEKYGVPITVGNPKETAKQRFDTASQILANAQNSLGKAQANMSYADPNSTTATDDILKASRELIAAQKEYETAKQAYIAYGGEIPGFLKTLGLDISSGAKSIAGGTLGAIGYATKKGGEFGGIGMDAGVVPITEYGKEKSIEIGKQLMSKSAEIQKSAADDLATANTGKGAIGRFANTVVSQGVPMVADIAANAIIPGSGLAAMGVRAFGNSLNEALADGADEDTAAMYALASTLVEVGTEKLGGIMPGYGEGILDGVTDRILARAKSEGQERAIKLITATLEEGTEEAISALLNPALKTIYDNQAYTKYLSKEGREQLIADALYDAVVGAALGGLGGTVAQTAEIAQTNRQFQGDLNAMSAAFSVNDEMNAQNQANSPITQPIKSETTAGNALTPAQQKIENYAVRGSVSNSEANNIINDNELLSAFREKFPNVEIKGTKSQQRAAIKNALKQNASNNANTSNETQDTMQTNENAPQSVPAAEVTQNTGKEQDTVQRQNNGTQQTAQPTTQNTQNDENAKQTAETDGAVSPAPQMEQTQQTVGDGNIRERGLSRNVATDTNREAELRSSFDDNPELYRQLSNNKTLSEAQNVYDKGLGEAQSELEQAIGKAKEGGKLDPKYVPLAKLVADELTRRGDVQSARRIISDVALELTQAGQLGQAARILRASSPSAQADFIGKLINSINSKLTKGQLKTNMRRGRGSAEGKVEISNELISQYANETDATVKDDILAEIQTQIAQQMPPTLAEQWTALRYVNMLGNLKTQGRNIIGNTITLMETATKRRVQAGIEGIISAVTKGEYERTTSVIVKPRLLKEAASDFKNVSEELRGQQKYSDQTRQTIQAIEDKRVMFGGGSPKTIAGKLINNVGKLAQNYINLTNWAMEAGDVIFLKATYADALGGWLQAHGIDSIDNASAEQLQRAREFAKQEALEATFRDSNRVSDFVSSFGRGKDTPKLIKAVGEGLAPFRKTPTNVAVRGIEYSPVGIAETIVKSVEAAKGEATAADVINSLSKNITGTGLAIAGYFLAAAGIARASNDDDEAENFEKLQGQMDYSVKVGDKYISLSQFAPLAIPFFMGVKLCEGMDGQVSLDDLNMILGCINDPMLEMSMLSSVNETLNNIGDYGNDAQGMWKLLGNLLVSYLTQGITNSLIGQGEQASEEFRQTIYTNKNDTIGKLLGTNIQYKIGQATAKIPGIDYNQQDYVDAWGRRQSNGDTLQRIFNSFINPTYTSEDKSREWENELMRLYTDNKDVSDFPSVLPKKDSRTAIIGVNSKGEDIILDPDEYEQYSVEVGQKKEQLVSQFINSAEYKNGGMTDEQKAKVISDLYALAKTQAQSKYLTKHNAKLSNNKKSDMATSELISGLPNPAEYYSAKATMGTSKNGNNKTLSVAQYKGLTDAGYPGTKAASIFNSLDADNSGTLTQVEIAGAKNIDENKLRTIYAAFNEGKKKSFEDAQKDATKAETNSEKQLAEFFKMIRK